MKRDIEKAIKEGDMIIKANERLDLRVEEIHNLLDKAVEDGGWNEIYEACIRTFKAGLAIGARYGKKQAGLR